MRDVDRVLERMGDLMDAHIEHELLTYWRLVLEAGASLDELQAALQFYARDAGGTARITWHSCGRG